MARPRRPRRTALDARGELHWTPAVREWNRSFSFDSVGSSYPSPYLAVMAWAMDREIDAVEIVAPGALSADERERAMQKRCMKTLDNLWERLRLMGDVEGGNGTGGEVTFVIDDAHGTETETWTADECDDALEGIRLAISAIDLIDVETDDD